MYTLTELTAFVETLAPAVLAESWDNVGALVRCDETLTGVLCALDVTPAVIRQAREMGCNAIVSHHPVIFRPLKQVCATDVPALLLRHGISAVCAHTNLDAAPGGVNDALAAKLDLEQVQPFAGLGRMGMLPHAQSPELLARAVGQALHTPVKWVDGGRPVQTVALVSGSGGSFVQQAIAAGADCLLTGEAGHHDALDAAAAGLTLLAAGHFATEVCVVPVLAEKLRAAFPRLNVVESTAQQDPFAYLA